MARVRTKEDERNNGVACIAVTWSCTKSFWLLRPMDELLSFNSSRRVMDFNHKVKS